MSGKRERDIENTRVDLSVCTALEPINYAHRNLPQVDSSIVNTCGLPAMVDVFHITVHVSLDHSTKTRRFAIYNYLSENESMHPGPELLARIRSHKGISNPDHHQARTYTSVKIFLLLSS